MQNGLLFLQAYGSQLYTSIDTYIYRCALLKPSEPKNSVHCIYTLSIVQDICLGSSFDSCADEGGGSTTGTHHSCLPVR